MVPVESAKAEVGCQPTFTKINSVQLSGKVTKPGTLSTLPVDGREFAEATVAFDSGTIIVRSIGQSALWLATARKGWIVKITGTLAEQCWTTTAEQRSRIIIMAKTVTLLSKPERKEKEPE